MVLEELDPVLEEEIRLLGIACEGKSIFPLCGELDPTVVRRAAAAAGLRGGPAAGRRRRARPPRAAGPPARPLRGLPAPRRLPAPLEEEGPGRRRHRVLHPGPAPAAVGDPLLRLHGRRDRRRARSGEGRDRRAHGGRDRGLHLLPHRPPGPRQRRLQPVQRAHDHPRQPHDRDDGPPVQPGHRPHAATAGGRADRPRAARARSRHPRRRHRGLLRRRRARDGVQGADGARPARGAGGAARVRAPARDPQALGGARGRRGGVHRVRHLLPHRLPGDPQERGDGREVRQAARAHRPRPVHGVRGLRPALPARRDPHPRPGPRGAGAPASASCPTPLDGGN